MDNLRHTRNDRKYVVGFTKCHSGRLANLGVLSEPHVLK